MPRRSTPFTDGAFYHVFNRGINHQTTFYTKADFERFINAINFYSFTQTIPLSRFLQFDRRDQLTYQNTITHVTPQIAILAYCIMPNHFHLLLKQEVGGNLSSFLSNIQNSYTRYFNIRTNRDCALFLTQFKAQQIMSEYQLLHTSRYIHLNPYSNGSQKRIREVYPWSSLQEYLDVAQSKICDTHYILNQFGSKTYREYLDSRLSSHYYFQNNHLTSEVKW